MQQPKTIILDSNEAKYSNGIYTFTLNDIIIVLKFVRLLQSQIPNVHPNFESGVNNYLDISIPSVGQQTIVIPQGNYDISTLVYDLQSLINAAYTSLNFTVTYSDTSSQITFTCSTNTPFSFLFGTGTNSSKACWQQLGFYQSTDVSSSTVGSTSVISSTTSAFLEGPTYCLIDIENLSPEPLITSKSYSGVYFVQVFQLSKSSIETQSCLTNFDQTVSVNNPNPPQLKQIEICLYCHVQNLPGVNHPFNTLGIPFILILEIL